MNFNFDSNATTIKNLFKKYNQFRIPIFQRDYSWDPLYYNEFLNDIINSLGSENESETASGSSKNYFIGTMVLSGATGSAAIDVVDGQQRLTVITILFSAISKRLKENGFQKLADATFRYVQEEDDNGELKQHLISDSSFPFLESFIQSLDHTHAASPKTLEQESLENTYNDFYKALDANVLQARPVFRNMDYRDILITIRDQLLSASIIEITTKNKNSAYKIFEILNAKGKGLASIDLIKNSVFEVYYNDKNGLEQIASDRWRTIQTNLRKRDSNIGLATFYRQYWISKYEKVTNAKLYDSFKKAFIDKYPSKDIKGEYMHFLKSMETESDEYIKIVHPLLDDYDNRQEYKPVVQSLESLSRVLGIKQYIVVVLALLELKKNKYITLQKLKECLRFIESFVFMYTDMGKGQANIYEARFSRLAIKLRESTSKTETDAIIKDLLYENLKEKRIDYSIFEDSFTKLTFSKSNNLDNKLSKYVIGRIGSSYENKEIFLENNSVEHIVPEIISDKRVVNIGNLIDLETDLNNEAQDVLYLQKKDIYSKSRNKQIHKFIDDNNNFTVSDIPKRAERLARYYYNNIIKTDLKYND